MISPPIRELVIQQSANDCFMKNMRKTGMGRFLPVAILSPDRQLLGESRHSSKEFICSVRPSLNDCFRLLAALQLFEKLSPRSAAIGHKRSIVALDLKVRL